MINSSFTHQFDQKKPGYNIETNDEDMDFTKEMDFKCCFSHSHPAKLTDFFNSGTIDESTLNKVQKLIKDISFFHSIAENPSMFKKEVLKGESDKDTIIGLNKISDCLQRKILKLVIKDITLLYTIYVYTSTALELADNKDKPMINTIAKIALAGLKRYSDSEAGSVAKLIESFLR